MKSVLITGAFGGMGKAATRAFAGAGYYVFALDKRVEEGIENVCPMEVDITNEESVQNAVQRVHGMVESLDMILHFAGIYTLDSFLEMDTKDMERAFSVNVLGAMRINKFFLPMLKKGGKILITSSELAPLDPLPFTGLYAVTKSALDKYAYSLRMETQLLGISVTVLRPGAVDTGMLGVSTAALDRFCKETKLYACNAKRFKAIVDSVESRKVAPEQIAKKALKIAGKKKPRFVYHINRNPLLLLLNVLPPRLQTWIIKKVLQ
ncbi:MAG: SDR family NAD(P)-dependent oxidoreductase [Clostridia bacterium]|nr:SDR family NAD(P)-dependent oxidoreductase [Clostridia bacterium]